MVKKGIISVFAQFFILLCTVAQNPKFAPVRTDIPMGGKLSPKEEEPVFAICSKQGCASLFRGMTERTGSKLSSLPDLGRRWLAWNYADYGMNYTEGVIGVFSGWGTPGIYIGSDNGVA